MKRFNAQTIGLSLALQLVCLLMYQFFGPLPAFSGIHAVIYGAFVSVGFWSCLEEGRHAGIPLFVVAAFQLLGGALFHLYSPLLSIGWLPILFWIVEHLGTNKGVQKGTC